MKLRQSTGRLRTRCAVLALALGWLGAACDAQVTADYRGEQLVTLRGNVVSSAGAPPAEAALLWWLPASSPDAGLATRVATEGVFPAAFTLSLFRTPPGPATVAISGAGRPWLVLPGLSAGGYAPAPRTCRGPAGGLSVARDGQVAVGTIAAVRPAVPDAALADNVVGLAEEVALLYVPQAGTYHLMKVEWLSQDAPGAFACQGGPAPYMRLVESAAGPDGMEVQIRIGAG